MPNAILRRPVPCSRTNDIGANEASMIEMDFVKSTSSELGEDVRETFTKLSEEYSQLCGRLFADEPEFNVDLP